MSIQEPECIHHSITGDHYIQSQLPDFFDDHPRSDTGCHWEVCIKCGRTKYVVPPHIQVTYKPPKPSRPKTEIVFEPGYVTPAEAAVLLGLDPNSIRIYLRDGKLKGRKLDVEGKTVWQVEVISINERKIKQDEQTKRKEARNRWDD